jgi:hypothetical protein
MRHGLQLPRWIDARGAEATPEAVSSGTTSAPQFIIDGPGEDRREYRMARILGAVLVTTTLVLSIEAAPAAASGPGELAISKSCRSFLERKVWKSATEAPSNFSRLAGGTVSRLEGVLSRAAEAF